MEPLIILFYAVSFSTGLITILFSIILYIKYWNRGFLLYALFLISIELLLCRLLLRTFTSFVLANLSTPYIYGPFLQSLSYYFDVMGFVLFIVTIPFLYHLILKMPVHKIHFSIYMILGLTGVLFGIFYIATHGKMFSLILKTISNGLILYGIMLLFIKRKEMHNPFTKKVCKILLILTLIFFPYFLIDGLLTSRVFAFPSYFLIINLAGIVFISSYIHKPISEALPPLKEKYDLTDREFEIVSLLHKGIRNTEIANALSIAKRTVETHVYRIYQKLEIKNRYELIALMENSRDEMPERRMSLTNQIQFFNKIHKKLTRVGNADSISDIENS